MISIDKFLFIINPIAGSKRNSIESLIELADDLLPEQTKEYVYTEYPGHAARISQHAIGKGYRAIVAAGGDGTLNEVAKALVNTSEILGIVPLGSGNGFARHLKIPTSPRKALTLIRDGRCIESDVGLFNNSYFLTTCGFGFEAEVASLFSEAGSRGFWTYAWAALKGYLRYKTAFYEFSIDQRNFKTPAFFLTLANSSQFGLNARIAPTAEIDSGKMVCCKVESLNWISVPLFALRLFTGRLPRSRNYEQYDCSAFFMDDYTGRYHIDGEPRQLESAPVHVRIMPKCLNVLAGTH